PMRKAARELGISEAELEGLVLSDYLDSNQDEQGREGIVGATWARFMRALTPAPEAAHHHAGPEGAGDGPALFEAACPKCRKPNPFPSNTKTMRCHHCGQTLHILDADEADLVPHTARSVGRFLHKLGSFVETGRASELKGALPDLGPGEEI